MGVPVQWRIHRGFHGFHGIPGLKGCFPKYYAQTYYKRKLITHVCQLLNQEFDARMAHVHVSYQKHVTTLETMSEASE